MIVDYSLASMVIYKRHISYTNKSGRVSDLVTFVDDNNKEFNATLPSGTIDKHNIKEGQRVRLCFEKRKNRNRETGLWSEWIAFTNIQTSK